MVARATTLDKLWKLKFAGDAEPVNPVEIRHPRPWNPGIHLPHGGQIGYLSFREVGLTRTRAVERGGFCRSLRDPSQQSASPSAVEALADGERTAALLILAAEERVLAAVHEAVAAQYANSATKADRALLATRHEVNRRRNRMLREVLLELGAAADRAGMSRSRTVRGCSRTSSDVPPGARWSTSTCWSTFIALRVGAARFIRFPLLVVRATTIGLQAPAWASYARRPS
jgi:hypothetical protein